MGPVEVKVGQTWRRTDPGGSFEDFEVVGFQNGRFGSPEKVVRGRTDAGKQVKVARHILLRDTARFTLLKDVEGPAAAANAPRPKTKRRAASSWRHPSGTPILLRLDDGTTVATETRSRAYDLAGGVGVVKTTHPHGPWCLTRVKLDQSRMLGALAARVLREVCAATARGERYEPPTEAEYRSVTRPKMAGLVERDGRGWRATRAGFAMVGLEPAVRDEGGSMQRRAS